MRALLRLVLLALLGIATYGLGDMRLSASEEEPAIARDYTRVRAGPARAGATLAQVQAASSGCLTCHTASDAPSMHESPAVQLGCTDCHGGDPNVTGRPELGPEAPEYVAARERAHVLPRYPHAWNYPSSANPERSYTLLNREAPEYIRFVNPGDYRVAREACGACHLPVIEAAERSLMASGAMLWGGAAYNNGIVPYKNYIFGEGYTAGGEPAKIVSPGDPPGTLSPAQAARGALAALYPLPRWNVIPPGDVFRVFERGGRVNSSAFAEVGLPNPSGSIQRLDEPGRPDLKQSNRGPGTGLRVAIPVLNIHKTRLNDPFTWFMGTNDQPGDYRSSGCTACHVVYANDREPRHSLIYASQGRDGQSATRDPAIAALTQRGEHGALKGSHAPDEPHAITRALERGHPLRHVFTRAIPTAQCMNCHMHQPNIFLNSYLGYTMWDYEADAPAMWPERQKYPTAAEAHEVLERNPEGAAPRGNWSDPEFLRNVYELNPQLNDTQFADYHGHGWNFRGIFKRDRAGNLLDEGGNMASWGTDTAHIVAPDDPEKWRKAGEAQFVPPGTNPGKSVHLMDIHAEKGMQCADCHFAQDAHGNGLIYGEVANAVEIGCKDCHGTPDAYPSLRTSGPAAPPRGTDLSLLRNPDGAPRFEWSTDAAGRRHLLQRSIVDPALSWEIALVKDGVDPASPRFNARSARAKLMSASGGEDGLFRFGPGVAPSERAHKDGEIACFTCHLSWTTSCGGCHLPIEANWKTQTHHYEGEETRNFATYNPQVARNEMFQLGRHMTTKGAQVAPIRSTSALVLSSTNANRERIYIQQPPVSAAGFSSQAFAPHFPHTVRLTETKTCTDCHLSAADDNNAILAQTLLLGTGFVNFVGLHSWVGLAGGFEAVRVTEWDEPQAVIGSYLQRYAYPDYYRLHVEENGRELKNWTRGKTFGAGLSGEVEGLEPFRNLVQGTGDAVGCLQLRGEYMYVAQGKGGFRVYDVASVANKGVSDAVLSAPFSPLGQKNGVRTRNATCMALATNQPIAPTRNRAMAQTAVLDASGKPALNANGTPMSLRDANQEQAFAPIYSYAVVTDAEEGLILVDIETFADGEFRNNDLKRALTWNPKHVLDGARHVVLAGNLAYVTARVGLVVVDLADPLHPRISAVRPLDDARASALQFRFLWVTEAHGVTLFDVTDMRNPVAVPSGQVALADARRLYLARTYAYVAGGREGLVILDVRRPQAPRILRKVTFPGEVPDVQDVVVASTNASLFAYLADGVNGMKVLQLTSPASQPTFYGFSPEPRPELIAWARTPSRALALSRGLDRDRAVDETGGQIAVFGRLGSRPFTRAEMERLFLTRTGTPYKVVDDVDMSAWWPAPR
ncbi:multiheme c-type cytochrome [Novosphingobium profundi]|uniref:LVIVD repeat-containing protein n=1 Tax=Novosphingobium profundi TaxID=1774954 RepID=UPI003CCE766C